MIDMTTIVQSKVLKASEKYLLKPMPVSFKNISKENMTKNIKFKVSKMELSYLDIGYLSMDNIRMLPTMQKVMNHVKKGLIATFKQTLNKQNL
jgi:hypothetical protein